MTLQAGTQNSEEEKPKKKKKAKKKKAKKKKGDAAKPKKVNPGTVIKGMRKFVQEATGISIFSDKISDALCVPCTNLAINRIVSAGRGFPFGRIIEFSGEESSGKSLLLYDLIAAVQQMGGYVILNDAEDALEGEWAARNGIDVDTIIPLEVDTIEAFFGLLFGEDGKRGIIQRIRKRDPKRPILVGCDSVAALSTDAVMDGSFSKHTIAVKARQLSKAFEKIRGYCKRQNVMLVFINQIRDKPGVMFGDPQTTPGGRALKFYSSLRLKFSRGKELKIGERSVGVRTRVKVIKNRVYRPHGFAKVNILFDQGMTRFSGLWGLLKRDEIIQQKKAKSPIWLWGDHKFKKSKFEDFVDKNLDILAAPAPILMEGDEGYEKIANTDS